MGLRAASLADMDAFEVNRKRKPLKLPNATTRRSESVILWRVDGSAVVATHPRRSTADCTNTLWRRMLCVRNVGRIKQQAIPKETVDSSEDDVDHDCLELGEPHQAPLMTDAGSRMQTAFNMRRWPQGWI